MKHLFSFLLCFYVIAAMTSCGEEMTTRSVKGAYEIDVPSHMQAAAGLNIDASLQYEDIHKEMYLAIIDEDKADFIEAFGQYGALDNGASVISNYARIQVDYFLESVKVIEKNEPKSLTINGMEAEQVAFTGHVEGVDSNIYYLMTFVEGKKNVYMIMTWTLEKFKEEHRSAFESMAGSLVEL